MSEGMKTIDFTIMDSTVHDRKNNELKVGTIAEHKEHKGNANKWKSGLPNEMDNQQNMLNKLRIMYGHHMLTWPDNQKKQIVLDGMVGVAKSKKTVG